MVLQPDLAQRVRSLGRRGRPGAQACACLLGLAIGCGKDQGPATTAPPDAATPHARSETPPESGGSPPGAATERPTDDAAGDVNGDEVVEELRIDGVRLRLHPKECRLTASFVDQERRHRFEGFPGQCHFAPDRDGQPWVVPTDRGKAVLVVGSIPADAGCDTALQVVVITERGPELSREIQRVSGCGPGPWDEMMYHVLASDRVALGGG